MDFKFSKDSGDSQQQEEPVEKKNQSALIVLLLLLVGGFTYIYFFTSLIKPQETPKPAVPQAPQAVKMPLPPHDYAEPAKADAKNQAKNVVQKAAATQPTAVTSPVVKPATTPAKPAPVVAKTAATQVKAKEDPKKVEPVKPGEKKSQAPVVADKKNDKTAAKTEDKKPAVTDKKGVIPKEITKKPVSDVQTKPEAVLNTNKTTSDSWSLLIGDFVLEEALSANMGQVRKAGFDPVIKPGTRKKTTMNRLFVSELDNRAAAQTALEKLKRQTSDAFVIEQGGKFAVYAGSYSQNEAVLSERERLKAAGFAVTVKQAEIAIPSQSLSVGPFKSKKAADAALLKLKHAGIKATLSQK